MVITSKIEKEPNISRPSPDEVLTYLNVLLGRSEFNASDRNRRFLSYVVKETLAGRGDRIKAYTVALAAFDRADDFDPLTDPIVRIEASRLRRALEVYYLTAGRSDAIRIDIPKGSYVATFAYADDKVAAEEGSSPAITAPPTTPIPAQRVATSQRQNWPAMGATLAALALAIVVATYGLWQVGNRDDPAEVDSRGFSILVAPFENTDSDATRAFVARGLTYEIIVGLANITDVAVFGADGRPDGDASNRKPTRSNYDYVLVGSVHSDTIKVRVNAILSDSRTGQSLRSWTFEENIGDLTYLEIQSTIAQQVVLAIKRSCTPEAEAKRVRLSIERLHAITVATLTSPTRREAVPSSARC